MIRNALVVSLRPSCAPEAAGWISASDPTVPLILFTIMEVEGLERAARSAGICAVVPKMQSWNLLKTIETAVTQSHRSNQ
jgi:hypothetical protein